MNHNIKEWEIYTILDLVKPRAPTSSLQDIEVDSDDPDESDGDCIADLCKGRKFATWRDLL